jgi:hypothetical protein
MEEHDIDPQNHARVLRRLATLMYVTYIEELRLNLHPAAALALSAGI